MEQLALGPVRFSTFTVLVGLGTLVGCAVAILRGRSLGLSVSRMEQMCLWIMVVAYLGGHAAGWLYEGRPLLPLLTQPWLLLSAGLASFGGFAGALLAIALFFVTTRPPSVERWKYADSLGFALPFGWMIGRIGCALVHDHPGIVSSSWLAVRYPDAPRYDLGVLEAMFLSAVCLVFLFCWNSRTPGLFLARFFLPYGIFRLAIEPLRAESLTVWGLAPDQYAAVVAMAFGGWVWFHLARQRNSVLSR